MFLGHTAQLSGGELALLRVIPEFSGIQMHVILAQDGPLADLLESVGASVEILPMGEHIRDLRKQRVRWAGLPFLAYAQSVTYVLQITRRLVRLHPDIIHTNTLKAALYGGSAARLARLPCVWHIRDRIAPDYLPVSAVRLVRLAARLLPNAVIANSHTTLETLPAGHPHQDAGRLSTRCPTWPPAELAAQPSFRVQPLLQQSECVVPSSPSADFRVAMVGRLAPWKGQDVFLRAFAKAFPDGKEVGILVGAALFGEDDYERQLRQLVGDLGIAERVEFRGLSVRSLRGTRPS